MFLGKTLRKTNTNKKKVTPKLEDDTKTEMATDKPSASTQPDAPDDARLRIQSGNQLEHLLL
jgi:hypothetical protein